MKRLLPLLPVLAAILIAASLRADLAPVRSEPNLEKRAKKALEVADIDLKEAEDAYRAGNLKQARESFDELGESVAMAGEALRQTGKNPSKSPKHFKNAEIKTREILRKLDDFSQEMSAEDRAILEKPKATIQQVHENLLLGIMSGKKH